MKIAFLKFFDPSSYIHIEIILRTGTISKNLGALASFHGLHNISEQYLWQQAKVNKSQLLRVQWSRLALSNHTTLMSTN